MKPFIAREQPSRFACFALAITSGVAFALSALGLAGVRFGLVAVNAAIYASPTGKGTLGWGCFDLILVLPAGVIFGFAWYLSGRSRERAEARAAWVADGSMVSLMLVGCSVTGVLLLRRVLAVLTVLTP